MNSELERTLDECLDRVRRGESIDACARDYAGVSAEFESLLLLALEISRGSDTVARDEFHTASRARLVSRLRDTPQHATRSGSLSGALRTWLRRVRAWFDLHGMDNRQILAPVGTVATIVVVAAIALNPSASALQTDMSCTITSTIGTVEICCADTDEWVEAGGGMKLEVGARLRTSPNSEASLRLFEGSTVQLLPGTEIELQQMQAADEERSNILIAQFCGRTWHRVMALIDHKSSYEVRTPAACCLVRGTQFLVEINEDDSTRVQVDEGTVAVVAEGEEVSVTAGHQVTVGSGAVPRQPIPTPDDRDNDQSDGQAEGQDDDPADDPDDDLVDDPEDNPADDPDDDPADDPDDDPDDDPADDPDDEPPDDPADDPDDEPGDEPPDDPEDD